MDEIQIREKDGSWWIVVGYEEDGALGMWMGPYATKEKAEYVVGEFEKYQETRLN